MGMRRNRNVQEIDAVRLCGDCWPALLCKGGRHLVYPEHTPLTNLQLTLLNKLGVAAEKLGDSSGQFKELSELS